MSSDVRGVARESGTHLEREVEAEAHEGRHQIGGKVSFQKLIKRFAQTFLSGATLNEAGPLIIFYK